VTRSCDASAAWPVMIFNREQDLPGINTDHIYGFKYDHVLRPRFEWKTPPSFELYGLCRRCGDPR
jgi:hypothetical protein